MARIEASDQQGVEDGDEASLCQCIYCAFKRGLER